MYITIIIPVYNGAKYLEKCITSCMHQTYDKIEILLINDGSTDLTENIILNYESKDKRIRHITQSNQGLVKSRKNGVSITKTDYFLFLDADDTLELNAVEKLVEEQKKTQSDIIFANFITEFANGTCLACSNNTFTKTYESYNVINDILKKKIAPTIWGKLIAKSLFLQINVPEFITIGEDAIAISQLLRLNPKISSINDNIYHYIQRETSMVNRNSKDKNYKRLLFMEYYKNLILDEFDRTEEIIHNLKHFLIGEVFDILRDGGNFNDTKKLYNWIIADDNLLSYKDSIGLYRIFLIKSFAINETFGYYVSYCYNKLRMFRNNIIKRVL